MCVPIIINIRLTFGSEYFGFMCREHLNTDTRTDAISNPAAYIESCRIGSVLKGISLTQTKYVMFEFCEVTTHLEFVERREKSKIESA